MTSQSPQWITSSLQDNDPTHSVLYDIKVFTGLRSNAGTSADVCFRLGGEYGFSGTRVLADRHGTVSTKPYGASY